MKEYQFEEWQRMVEDAESSTTTACLLIEDEVIMAVDKDYTAMYNFIRYIANDYFELSHEKVRIQRDDYVRMARDLLEKINEDD
jgi:hypothetical protein